MGAPLISTYLVYAISKKRVDLRQVLISNPVVCIRTLKPDWTPIIITCTPFSRNQLIVSSFPSPRMVDSFPSPLLRIHSRIQCAAAREAFRGQYRYGYGGVHVLLHPECLA